MNLNKIKTIIVVLLLSFFVLPTKEAKALDTTANNFLNYGIYNEIINDDAFTAYDSMTVDQIQSFLVINNSYLKDYSESGRSAAQIIWDAAHANTVDSQSPAGWRPNGIPEINQTTGTVNPKVILVMLQKEQSLITRTTYNSAAMTWALGYGCPDGSACKEEYAGFSKQVDWGAWQLRFNWYRAQGYSYTNYQVGATETISDYTGTYNVKYANRATSAVYRYTPHVFDSAYNFWKFYNNWFGQELTLNVSPYYGGAIWTAGLNCFTDCKLPYAKDSNVALTAYNNPDYEFFSWDGDATTPVSNKANVIIDANKRVVANFVQSFSPSAWYTNMTWDVARSDKMVAGDFNGDDKEDVAILYDYSGGMMKLWVFTSNGSGYNTPVAWYTNMTWDVARSDKMVAGDFDGDGKDDLSILYDYGGGMMKLWNFTSNGSSFNAPVAWYTNMTWDVSRSDKMLTGDFNGDNKDDLGILYDYGGGMMKLWNFTSNGSNFNAPVAWYTNQTWDVKKTTYLVSGDFDGNGTDDLSSIYDYGGGMMKLWVFTSNGSGFNPPAAWYTNMTWDVSRSNKMVAGDFNGDTKDDLSILYDYGGGMMKIWNFTSGGSNFNVPKAWYTNQTWDVSRSNKMEAGDFDGDGKDDLSILYDYGGGMMKLWSIHRTGYVYSK